jgi:hypothetical protein
MNVLFRRITMLLFLLIPLINSYSQITTSGLKGRIVDEKNEPLPGANVIILHQPSGTQYTTTSNIDGRFFLNNLRVGGPYQVTFSFIGYKSEVYNDIYLTLGNISELEVSFKQAVTELNEVVIQSKNNLLSSGKTGTSINLSNDKLTAIPSISRGLTDFTKISPLANTAGSGTSFAGANNRYNQFSIDGIVNNDVFGLTSTGTNGGQAGIQPISLDAIEEIQINIAPYDVRQGGFTGGGINAITKSGTNDFHGSAYYYFNNQHFVGNNEPITNTKQEYAKYTDFQEGLTLGGPVITNKLFFFLSGEITKNKTPLSNEPGSSSSKITLDEINRVLAVLNRVAPNYDPGSYSSINNETNSQKLLAKLDWNINDKHKLTLRHSYTYGENISNSRSSSAMRFYNNGIFFPSTTNSTGLELNSNFNATTSNKLMLGYTNVHDHRQPLGSAFPTILINDGSNTITLGSEYSSGANDLKQDIFNLTDDFTKVSGKHTLTFGTHNEMYKFYNLFVQNIYGYYAYNSLANFETVGTTGEVAPSYYAVGYSFDTSDDPSQSKGAAKFKALQLGFYGQDEYQATDNLQVTGGLRIDIPMFLDKPGKNDDFNTAYTSKNVATGDMPKSKIMWSPRLGFNWNVLGDKTLVVRGGTGLFTGRVPFVWVSNQFSNNGELNGTYSVGNSSSSGTPITSPSGIKFVADPYKQPHAEDFGKTAGRGAINVVDKNFQFPQVFRSNIAIDKVLPYEIIATVEGVFSKTLNNINYINLNRSINESFTFAGVDQRPRYISGRTDSNYDEILKLENTNKGYAYNFTFQLQKQFLQGFNAMAAYTFGHSEDLNSGTSSVAYSNWRYVNQVNGLNNLSVSTSNFDMGSRIMGFISYKKEYLNNSMSTQISLFYNGQSGQSLSYIYNGDMNNDGTSNDLIYIPKSKSDINLIDIAATSTTSAITADQQWTNLNAFIESDNYLKKHRGEYAKRNAARLPFQHEFDLHLLQEFKIKTGKITNKIQITVDIINVGNLLNKDWGRSYTASNQQCALINYKSLVNTNQPTFTYTGSSLVNNKPYSASDPASRWRAQFGVRYIF